MRCAGGRASTWANTLACTQKSLEISRYALRLGSGEIREQVESQFENRVDAWEDEQDYHADRGYNISPRTRNPVVLRGGGGGGTEEGDTSTQQPALRLENMQWGLIPHWMKRQPDHATSLRTINARDDTIM